MALEICKGNIYKMKSYIASIGDVLNYCKRNNL